jgi:hypothetical protein
VTPIPPAGTSPTLQTRPAAPKDYGPDAQIVTSVENQANELPEGTLLRTRLQEEINTQHNQSGTAFTAYITDDIKKNGKVVIPAFSTLRGRIVNDSSASLIHGGANISLRPDEVITPDGTRYLVHATTVQTEKWTKTKSNNEGIVGQTSSAGRTAGTVGMTTGVGAGAGLLIGGPAGLVAGASIGAGVGTIHWMARKRIADLPKDSRVVFSLSESMDIDGFQNNVGLKSTTVTGLQSSIPATPQPQWQRAMANPVETNIATTPY